jgi:hypothetical protein
MTQKLSTGQKPFFTFNASSYILMQPVAAAAVL